MKLFENTINEEYKFKGRMINLKIQAVELPNGRISSREIVEHPGGVAIVAYLDADTLILVEQFRKPIDRILLEIPAGKLELGEDPRVCGIRELEEETGYKAKKFEYLGKIVTTPGFSNEYIYLFKAENLYKGEVNMDEDEFINLKTYKISEIKKMVKSGEIIDGKTIAALAYI
ncbi:MAG: NUDIX hydrolase [Clostridium sp.]|uniref:NUDIX hydrolase n=1 Tax=Clostridium sp. TaxID=1506 RepID=UPI00303DF95E